MSCSVPICLLCGVFFSNTEIYSSSNASNMSFGEIRKNKNTYSFVANCCHKELTSSAQLNSSLIAVKATKEPTKLVAPDNWSFRAPVFTSLLVFVNSFVGHVQKNLFTPSARIPPLSAWIRNTWGVGCARKKQQTS